MSHYPLWSQSLSAVSLVSGALENRSLMPIIPLMPLTPVRDGYSADDAPPNCFRRSPGNPKKEAQPEAGPILVILWLTRLVYNSLRKTQA